MKPSHPIGLVIAILAVVSATFAQSNKSGNEIQSQKIDALFAQWNKPNSPGCALAVIKNGQVLYKHGYGIANLDYDIPISSKTVFDIGSMST